MTAPLARRRLGEIIAARAREQPGLVLYRFLRSGGIEESLTAAALEIEVRRLAAHLSENLEPGERALLLYPPGLEYIVGFFACLEAGIIAVPAYPLDAAQASRTGPRLAAILADCGPRAVLTTQAGLAQQALLPERPPAALRWIASPPLRNEDPASIPDLPRRPADPRHLAYLQYTSGSTGRPRGVRITHANLLHNSALIEARFGHGPESRGVIWLPPYHDMGLIGGIVQPLYVGFPVTLFSHLDFLKHPLKWLREISRTRATTSGGPNFAYEMAARLPIAAADFAALDLGAWEIAFTGAEPIRPATLEAFARRFAPAGFKAGAFYPCYGLAEHTLFVTGGTKGQGARIEPAGDAAKDGAAVGCGSAPAGVRLAIVTPGSRRECKAGETGEIWIRGPSVAQGYWHQAAANRRTFAARLKPNGEGPFLRTGDLGFCREGELFVTGRLKDLIVVRGVNHYPPDLEDTIERQHPALFRPGGSAVFALEQGTEPRIVALRELRARYARELAEGKDGTDGGAEEILAAIRRAVSARHGLALAAVLLLKPASLPKTTSGKLQRQACRRLFLDNRLPVVREWREPGLVQG